MRSSRVLVLPAFLVGMAGIIPGAFAHPAAALKAAVAVTPNPVPYNTNAYISVATVPGAKCMSTNVYNDGSTPTNWQNQYKNKWYKAAKNGVVIWTWTFKKRHLSSGKTTVTCTSNGITAHSTLVYKVK
jgi:hypothetical protein